MAKKAKLQKKKQYRSKILRAIHETAIGLNSAGTMSDEMLSSFSEACLIDSKQQLQSKAV